MKELWCDSFYRGSINEFESIYIYILFCNLTYFSTVIRPNASFFLNMFLYISDIHLWMYSCLYMNIWLRFILIFMFLFANLYKTAYILWTIYRPSVLFSEHKGFLSADFCSLWICFDENKYLFK